MKQHRTAISLVISPVILCAAYVSYEIVSSSSVQETDDAYVRADSVMISSRLPGQIAKVLVEDNQPVKQGQELAELDDRDYRATLASATANVAASKAQLINLQATIERQAAVVNQTAATIRATSATLQYAQANERRYRNLSDAGAGTQQEHQKAKADLLSLQASLERDEAARVAAMKQLDVLKAQVEVAKATLAKDEASLEQAQLNVSYTKITAPRDGVVGQRSVREGAYVSQGQSLMAVVPLHKAFVVANFRETQLAKIAVHQEVNLHVDSIPDQDFLGRIDSVAPASGVSFSEIVPDNATGNFTKIVQRIPVKIVFDPNQADLDRLRIGMSVVVNVDTSKGQ